MTDKKTPVLLAVPMRVFGKIDDLPAHLQQLLALLVSWQKDLPWTFDMMTFGGGNVARGRNKIVASFLRGKWKWISFVDDDVFPVDGEIETMARSLIRILSHKLHVCGALYTTKDEKRPHWVMNGFNEAVIDENGLLPVPELGTGGFKTYHRSVFEYLVKNEPGLAYRCDDSASPEYGFFCQGLMMVEGRRRWLPEDYWMDQLCRKHKIAVAVDTTIRLKHVAPDGRSFPLNDAWPALPGPREPMKLPVIAEELPFVASKEKLLICLQYWEGDREGAMKLARHIAGMEEGRDDVILMFVQRHDAKDVDTETLAQVCRKFEVCTHVSPVHKTGYPNSPNVMALDAMRNATEFTNDATAVLLMEADCVPVAPDWIDQLMTDWSRARKAGKLLMGSWRRECTDVGHLNGNLVFDPAISQKIVLPDVVDQAWDIELAKVFEPHWCRTGLIRNRYMEILLEPDELLIPECGSKAPVLIHGVKDSSVWNSLTV